MTIKAMIIEEIPALRLHAKDLLVRTLSASGQSVEILEASDGNEAMKMFDEHKPAIVVMDTVIPGVGGLKVAQYIWRKAPTTRILFWVNMHREFHIRELKRIVPDSAVDGYILQSAGDEKFCRAIESVFTYNNAFIDPALRSGNMSFSPVDSQLTDVEQETLGDLLLGLTDKAIARKRNLTVRGVQNRLASLAAKLLKTERSQAQQETGIEFYNLRARMIFEALKRGIYTVEDIPELEKGLNCWMENTNNAAAAAGAPPIPRTMVG